MNFLTLDEDEKLFNTNLAFGRDGSELAKYRKFHLFGEEQNKLDRPAVPDVSFFETDFGAKIGMMICFDMCFEEPGKLLKESKIDALAYSTAWDDEVPFCSGNIVGHIPGNIKSSSNNECGTSPFI